MTRAFMIDLFSGLSEFIVLKSRQMATIAMECANAKDMIEELKNATDPARIKVLLELIEQTTADDRIDWQRPLQTNGSVHQMGISGITIFA